jgi:chromosome segregation ATPase
MQRLQVASLQEFSKLFTELEDSVVKLEKRHKELAQDNSILESKVAFKNKEIAEVTESLAKVRLDYDNQTRAMTQRLDEAKTGLDAFLVTADQRRDKIESQLYALNTGVVELETTIKTLEDKKHGLNDAISDLQDELAQKNVEIDALGLEIDTAKSELAGIDKQIEAAEAHKDETLVSYELQVGVAADELAKAQSKVDDKLDELVDTTEKLEAADAKLAVTLELDKKLEKKARDINAQLEAREESLLKREDEFESQMITARRRHSILDK